MKRILYIFVAMIAAFSAVALSACECNPGQEAASYKVEFVTDGGSKVDGYRLKEGESIPKPQTPTKPMFTFLNWCSDEARKEVFELPQAMPAHDLTLYAQWLPDKSVLVTLNANGGKFDDETESFTKILHYGDVFASPDKTPERYGYVFGGWYVDSGCSAAYDFTKAVEADSVLYAKWNDDPGFVYAEYYVNGVMFKRVPFGKGSAITDGEVSFADAVVDGWYTDAARTEKYEFGAASDSNLRLYAGATTKGLVIENGEVKRYTGNATEVVVPDYYGGVAVTAIGEYAFDGTSAYFGVTDVYLPDGITEIKEGAFYHCGELKNVNITSAVTRIGEAAFAGDFNLRRLGDISGVTEIAARAFLGCENINNISLPSGLNALGEMAFADCKKLTSVSVPAGIINVPDGLFVGCENLREIVFEAEGMREMTFGKGIADAKSLQSVTIKTKTRAKFAAVTQTYLSSPFVGCDNATIYVDSLVAENYRTFYGYLDNNTFGAKIAAIGGRSGN